MVYGYARVSTTGQAQDGNSLVDQQHKLHEAGAQVVYSDSFSGKTMQRPEFTKLINALQPGDTLMCTKLDRFARTADEGAQTVQELLKRGITVDILNMGRVDDSPIGRLLVQVLFSFAEFERSQIVERTQAGRRVAMENGQVMGRPRKYSPDKINLAMRLLDEGKTYPMVERMTGISKSTLLRNRRKRVEHDN